MKPFALLLLLLLPLEMLLADSPEDIFKKFRSAVVRVSFNRNINSQSQIGSTISLKENRIGVVVSETGMVMVDSDVFPLSLDIMSVESGGMFSGEPSDFKIHLGSGGELEADFVGKDEEAQVAFLQVKGVLKRPLPFVKFSQKQLAIGERAYLLELLGEGYQYEPLFTPVTINAVITEPNISYLVKNEVTALSAGGLVLNSAGDAVGITARGKAGMSFSMHEEFEDFRKTFLTISPASRFTRLIANPPALEKAESNGKSWLGINMQALTESLQRYWQISDKGGIVVTRVLPESPAQAVDLRVGDVVLSIDGEAIPVDDDDQLERFRSRVITRKSGENLKLKVFREGDYLEKTVVLASAPPSLERAAKRQFADLGLEVREITRDVIHDYNLPTDQEGVVVYQVDRASPAGLGGLESGAVITHLDGETIRDLSSFADILEREMKKKGTHLMFQVRWSSVQDILFVEKP